MKTTQCAWVGEAIETKYFAQGNRHIGRSGAQTQTHGLVIWSPALFHWTTLALKDFTNTDARNMQLQEPETLSYWINLCEHF